jgi:putative transposon-encoded protein
MQGEAIIKSKEGEEHRYPVHAFVEKTVSNGANSGRIFVPKAWKNKRVIVLLVEK